MLSVYGTRKPMHHFSITAFTVAGVLELVLFCRDNLQGRVTPWITTITFRFTPMDNLMRMSETVGRAVRTCELHSGSRREWNLQPCCCEATAITTAPLSQSTNSSGGKNMTVWLRCFEAQHLPITGPLMQEQFSSRCESGKPVLKKKIILKRSHASCRQTHFKC